MSRANYTEDELAIRALLGTYRDAEEQPARFVNCPFLEMLIVKGLDALHYLSTMLDDLSKRRHAARRESICKMYNIDITKLDELTLVAIERIRVEEPAVWRHFLSVIGFIGFVGVMGSAIAVLYLIISLWL